MSRASWQELFSRKQKKSKAFSQLGGAPALGSRAKASSELGSRKGRPNTYLNLCQIGFVRDFCPGGPGLAWVNLDMAEAMKATGVIFFFLHHPSAGLREGGWQDGARLRSFGEEGRGVAISLVLQSTPCLCHLVVLPHRSDLGWGHPTPGSPLLLEASPIPSCPELGQNPFCTSLPPDEACLHL